MGPAALLPLALGLLALALPGLAAVPAAPAAAAGAARPVAIYHAFQEPYGPLAEQVCERAREGYSHVQISPAQRSNPGPEWWKRYQPVDHAVIEGLGSEADLRRLISRAHGCGLRVIADVVFNHMANLGGGDAWEDLTAFPGLTPQDFRSAPPGSGRRPCADTDLNGYADGNRRSELECWLGGLPDLLFTPRVVARQRQHLALLLKLGIDGFRFDAAKHMPPEVLRDHLAFIARSSGARAWNYLEVIEDGDTPASVYDSLAPLTDFRLYRALRELFRYGGDLRRLPPRALPDAVSVSFGRNHDTVPEIHGGLQGALDPYTDPGDAVLATVWVLARQGGTPLVYGPDSRSSAQIRTAVRFRRILAERTARGAEAPETVLRVLDDPEVAVMERGGEGMVLLNKGATVVDRPVLDLTLTRLEGCYRELGSDLSVAIERRGARKFVTRWGSWRRGGVRLPPRQALLFIRDPFSVCSSRP